MSKRRIRVCIDRPLGPEGAYLAGKLALQERPDNAPLDVPHDARSAQVSTLMAIPAWRNWKVGRSLRVRFLDGEEWQRSLVREVASEWTHEANLAFVFESRDQDAEIRVSFTPNGSSSYVGVDAVMIPQDQRTMNLGWVDRDTEESEIRGTILHEFGHAIGCVHEHQSPTAGVPWDKEVVYAYYFQTDGWSREDVDNNLFDVYDRTQTLFTAFDPASIMMYAIPEEHTVGTFSVSANNALSDFDRAFIRRIYPPTTEIWDVLPTGEPVHAEIGLELEEDHFRLKIETGGKYRVETSGPTNVRVAVYGPDDDGRFVASDDDSGIDGYNARIDTPLMKGTYAIRVRHAVDGIGTYELRVIPMG